MKLLSTILLILICQCSFAQGLDKVQAEYLILGTLDDYMGRRIHPSSEDELDRYDRIQGPLVDVIDSILKSVYPDIPYQLKKHKDADGNFLGARIDSEGLSKKFNLYYRFEEDPSMNQNGKPVLNGKLKEDIFNTEEEKFAFITGAYLRFGIKNDNAFCLNIGNSVSKAQVAFKLLKELGCRPSMEIIPNIPRIHRVYFHPTDQMKTYFQPFMYVREQLED